MFEFNTLSNMSAKQGNKRVGYEGGAEYFAVYSNDNSNHTDPPPSNMYILAAAALSAPDANVQTWLVPGATHARAYKLMGKSTSIASLPSTRQRLAQIPAGSEAR
jgi:hypothetical protein